MRARWLLPVALLVVTACDTAEPEAVPFLIVTLEGGAGAAVVAFETEDGVPCPNPRILADVRESPTELVVVVSGIGEDDTCEGEGVRPATLDVPLAAVDLDGFVVRVTVAGQTDEYVIEADGDALTLRPVQTSISRLGPR